MKPFAMLIGQPNNEACSFVLSGQAPMDFLGLVVAYFKGLIPATDFIAIVESKWPPAVELATQIVNACAGTGV